MAHSSAVGSRLVGDFLNGQEFYLHDGRARSVDEAIRLHGGTAAVQQSYEALGAAGQAAVVEFVKSL